MHPKLFETSFSNQGLATLAPEHHLQPMNATKKKEEYTQHLDSEGQFTTGERGFGVATHSLI